MIVDWKAFATSTRTGHVTVTSSNCAPSVICTLTLKCSSLPWLDHAFEWPSSTVPHEPSVLGGTKALGDVVPGTSSSKWAASCAPAPEERAATQRHTDTRLIVEAPRRRRALAAESTQSHRC